MRSHAIIVVTPRGEHGASLGERGECRLVQALVTAGSGEQGRVVKWMADRTEPTGDPAAVAIEDLHMDYEVWCLSNGLQSSNGRAFNDEFDRVRELPELAGKIRKFGSRYYGIHLVDRKIARLAKRNA